MLQNQEAQDLILLQKIRSLNSQSYLRITNLKQHESINQLLLTSKIRT